MKAGWEVKTLGEVSKINYGYTESASSEPIGSKFLRITDIQNDCVNWESVPYCKIETNEIIKYQLIDDDIVFARTGATTGKSFLVKEPPENAVFASYLIRLRLIDKTVLLPEFLFLFFQSAYYWQSIKEGTAGSAQGGFNATKLAALFISIPPLLEQQRIVAILDKAFASIATAKANTEQNLKNARALFDSYLHEVFSQRGEGWEEKRLVEIAKDFGRGKSKNRPRNDPKLYGGKYPFIQTGDIRNATHLITSYSQTYNETGLAQSKLWAKGTVCITIAANIAETAILNFDACFPDSVIGVTVDENKANNKFLEYLLQSFKSELQAKGKGSAQDNINMGTFENQLFPFPSLEKQNEIVAKFDILQKETQRLETLYQRKLTALDELKKSLLYKAFNGEL